MSTQFGFIGAGKVRCAGEQYPVHNPYDETVIAVVHRAQPADIDDAITADIDDAITAAVEAFEAARRLPGYRRSEILSRVIQGSQTQREELAQTMALEAGKPIRTRRAEVGRTAFTFSIAAEEARRIGGGVLPLDWQPGAKERMALFMRVPLSPIAGITPCNFPLDLVAHKVTPLAAGNSIITRRASQTPLNALKLGRIILNAGWPASGISNIPSSTSAAQVLIADERLRMLTFTGSPAIGWGLKSKAGCQGGRRSWRKYPHDHQPRCQLESCG